MTAVVDVVALQSSHVDASVPAVAGVGAPVYANSLNDGR